MLIECIMNHSYFKQPTGTYKTLNGFSMGDCSAARGSELILRISELKIFKKLRNDKNLTNISKYLRFRDDVSIHPTGSFKEYNQHNLYWVSKRNHLQYGNQNYPR